MTGYFEIKTYCELAGVSENTAYQRRLRGQIPYVMGENGLYYLYFTNDEKPLDGFIPLKTYAAKHQLSSNAVHATIMKGKFKNDEAIFCRRPNSGTKARHWYIREDAEYPDWVAARSEAWTKFVALRQERHRNSCPYDEGYITINEWAALNNLRLKTARTYAYVGRIPSKRINGFVYIPKDYVYTTMRGAHKQ